MKISVKFTQGGVQGILQALKEMVKGKNSPYVYGYIPYALIQPDIENNTEAKVFCFNGEPIGINPMKIGRGASTLGHDNQRLLDFARDVCAKLRAASPYLISDQLLRVDIFENRGRLIVNEVEGMCVYVLF